MKTFNQTTLEPDTQLALFDADEYLTETIGVYYVDGSYYELTRDYYERVKDYLAGYQTPGQ